jgi:DNA replication protein DnaC
LNDLDNLTIQEYFNELAKDNQKQIINGSISKWHSFDSDRHPDLINAVKTIKRWYNERLPQGGALIISGNYGCGKTHLCQAIKDLYSIYAIMFDEMELFKNIQAGYNGYGTSEAAYMKQARRAKLLIYDDLGSYETDNLRWVQGFYRQLFDKRYEEGKGYLITTNLSLKNRYKNEPSPFAERVGGRNFSRIMGATELNEYVINLSNVPDYRLRKF